MLPLRGFLKKFVVHKTCAFQVRFGSVWPQNYVEPFTTREELDAVKQDEEESKKLTFAPVKAARNDRSSSVFYDAYITKFTNVLMKKGKRYEALDNMHKCLYEIKKEQLAKYWKAKTDEERASIQLDPTQVFKEAVTNCMPRLITRRIKRGGATYQVPVPVPAQYSSFLAIKWFITVVRERPDYKWFLEGELLAKEALMAFMNEGKAVKKKQDMHKLCEANKAYAHYRWS